MKKTTLCIWFILILIMTGCGEKKPASDIIVPTEYVFSGENDLWKGEDPSQFKGDYEYTLTLIYLGAPEDLADVEQLEIHSQGELKKTSYREEFLHVEQMDF